MRTISLSSLIRLIQQYVDGRCDYETVRSFVFSRYEGECELRVEDDADDLLSVLAPYFESEEAFGDKHRDIRLRRLVRFCEEPIRNKVSTSAVFAMNFDEIQQLLSRVEGGVISDTGFREQIRKLSPVVFDVDSVVAWGRIHKGQSEPDSSLIS